MTSETVQAAQRLLAERERFGLAKYGTTVDRTDLQAGDWLQHAIEEASDLLLYLIRLQQMMQPAAAPEDAERAAYLARWKDAPKGATHLSEDIDGCADWWEGHPSMGTGHDDGIWVGGSTATWAGAAITSILGSVRCEPRPEAQP